MYIHLSCNVQFKNVLFCNVRNSIVKENKTRTIFVLLQTKSHLLDKTSLAVVNWKKIKSAFISIECEDAFF